MRNREPPEYKAAVGFLRDLMAAGVFPPDVATITQSRPQHAQGRFVMAIDGNGNSWIDLLRQGSQFGNRFHLIKPFAATYGGKPPAFLTPRFPSINLPNNANPHLITKLHPP